MSEYQNTIGAGFDYLTAGTQPSEKGVAPGQKNTLRLYDQKGDPANIGRGEITVYDFSQQGYNHPEGDFSQHSNGFAWSELVTHRPGELVPPLAVQSLQAAALTGNLVGLHSANAFSTLIMGAGSAANLSLWNASSLTDFRPSVITYSPAAEICSLTTTLASGAERLAVGHVGQPVKLMSDATGTVASTMHADTNSCWGIILSGINATTAGVPVMLMYCGTTIKTKATDADMTTALVATVPPTTVNAGGFAIGAIKAAGRAQRAYWAIPKVSNTSGALKFGAEAYMDVKSTDMTGSDLLPHKLDYLPNGILGAVPYRDGFLMHDGYHVVYWDGDDEYDLGLFRRRTQAGQTTNAIDSDERKRVRSLITNGPECGVIWQWFDANATLPGSLYMELYNYEAGSWHNFGAPIILTATGAVPDVLLTGAGGLPVSFASRAAYVWTKTDARFQAWFLPRPAESLLWQISTGAGGTDTTGMPTFDDGCSLLGCRWWLDEVPPGSIPGTRTIKRAPKVITEVEFDGNLDHGGTAVWTFNVKVQGRGIDGTSTLTAYDKTFEQGKPSGDYLKKNAPAQRANIQDVQFYLTATATSGGRKIPQLLPLTVRFAYSKDGNPITSLPEDTTG
jgi:hypothetical protein